MELTKIEYLLEKYDNGETTLAEEAQLKHYFTQATVAPHLEVYKPMFMYFLDSKAEQFTKDIPLQSETKTPVYKWISVAAVIALLFGLYVNRPIPQDELGTYDDPQLAYNEVVKSLQLISNSINQGRAQVQRLDGINQARSQVTYLDEMEDAVTIIFKPKQ